MSNKQLLEYWATINDPWEALKVIVDNSDFFGYDPYYGDMHNALLDMAERIVKEREE